VICWNGKEGGGERCERRDVLFELDKEVVLHECLLATRSFGPYCTIATYTDHGVGTWEALDRIMSD